MGDASKSDLQRHVQFPHCLLCYTWRRDIEVGHINSLNKHPCACTCVLWHRVLEKICLVQCGHCFPILTVFSCYGPTLARPRCEGHGTKICENLLDKSGQLWDLAHGRRQSLPQKKRENLSDISGWFWEPSNENLGLCLSPPRGTSDVRNPSCTKTVGNTGKTAQHDTLGQRFTTTLFCLMCEAFLSDACRCSC